MMEFFNSGRTLLILCLAIYVNGILPRSMISVEAHNSNSDNNNINNNNSNEDDSMLGCHRRVYNHTIVNTDENGRTCWDTVPVLSCWGRCDSNEIADWKFPYKKSHHPVCVHETREIVLTELKNCEDNVRPGTEKHYFAKAITCGCYACKSSETNCENLLYKGEEERYFYPMNNDRFKREINSYIN